MLWCVEKFWFYNICCGVWKISAYHSIFFIKKYEHDIEKSFMIKLRNKSKEDFQIMLSTDNYTQKLLGLEDVIITKVQRNLNETLVFVELPRNTFIIIKNRQYELHDLNL